MKIGIITSGNDTIALFKFLHKYDNEYIIYYDFLNRSYGDKPFNYSFEEIKKWIWFLIKKWVQKIILPPLYELAIHNHVWNEKIWKYILPLFQNYLHNYCFKFSLVGKIWFFWDYADIEEGQKLLIQEEKKYKLTEHQKNIKKFHFPFKYRSKETWLRKYYMNVFSYSSPMVNKVIKHDLKYFKDASIDTAIPLNYGYFNYQKTISKFFNYKKIRFHKIQNIEQIFKESINLEKNKTFKVNIYYTWHINPIIKNKKILWMLQRWEKNKIHVEEIKN